MSNSNMKKQSLNKNKQRKGANVRKLSTSHRSLDSVLYLSEQVEKQLAPRARPIDLEYEILVAIAEAARLLIERGYKDDDEGELRDSLRKWDAMHPDQYMKRFK